MKRGPKLDNLTYKDALQRLAEKARAELERMGHSVEGRSNADLVQSYTRERKRAKFQQSMS